MITVICSQAVNKVVLSTCMYVTATPPKQDCGPVIRIIGPQDEAGTNGETSSKMIDEPIVSGLAAMFLREYYSILG